MGQKEKNNHVLDAAVGVQAVIFGLTLSDSRSAFNILAISHH
jgi:hypothetical protein